ncbi:unnamed protein product [Psylliodes chrysocephalus]|uniref:Lipase n=1 Tax=Psylliodes chrysocephalus TaxID=3402493 RepID=A0A9P0G5M5_9CUCU|nr:unnamed protein product [Psylliodes chrysocephala]
MHQSKVIKTVYVLSLLPIIIVTAIKVCFKIQDYNLLNFIGKNCYDNPVVNQNISEIIQSWRGFRAEEHYIVTEDGYRLLVERSYSKITQKTPIIIVHGIAMSALGWVNRGNVSLARLLGDLGYDVWMLNYRGTWYSKGHVNLTTEDPNYWKYTLHELGVYDVRSIIKLVNEKTRQIPIYIGYSMGTTGFFIYSTSYPEEAKSNVKAMIGLAPVTNYKESKSIAKYTSYWWPLFKSLIYRFWNGEILPGYSLFLRPLVRFSSGIYMIQSFANLIFGDDFEQIDALTYPQFATQLIDTAGVEVYSHYLQFYETDRFGQFDFGTEKNLKEYGTPTPPVYDLLKNQVPIALSVAENDWLATMVGSNYTYSQLSSSTRCGFRVVPYKKWNHIDYLVAKDLPKYLYKYLFQKIKELDEGLCTST